MVDETEEEGEGSPEERVYDEQIAPLLRQANEIAAAHNLPMVALVKYPGGVGSTLHLPPQARSSMLSVAALAGRSRNLDNFMFKLVAMFRGRPHSSIMLKMLGLPPGGGNAP